MACAGGDLSCAQAWAIIEWLQEFGAQETLLAQSDADADELFYVPRIVCVCVSVCGGGLGARMIDVDVDDIVTVSCREKGVSRCAPPPPSWAPVKALDFNLDDNLFGAHDPEIIVALNAKHKGSERSTGTGGPSLVRPAISIGLG
eukprot:1154367-Pelagomonas_calceolata.AAC.2